MVAQTSAVASSRYGLADSQSFCDDLHEALGDLAIVEQFNYTPSARFAHLPPQIAVAHEGQKILGDVGNAGRYSAVRGFGKTMRWLVS